MNHLCFCLSLLPVIPSKRFLRRERSGRAARCVALLL